MSFQGKTIKVKLPVVLFEDDGCMVLFCPAVNVYGYGATEEEASESLRISLEEFFTYTLRKHTLTSELEKLGWTAKKKNRFIPPTFSSLLDKNKDLYHIFNTRRIIKEDRMFDIPAFC